MQKAKKQWQKDLRSNYSLSLMVLLGILFMALFSFVPMYGIAIAFQKMTPTDSVFTASWLGLANFIYFLSDAHFWHVLWNTVVLSFGKLLIGFPAAIILAVMISETHNQAFKKVFQTISYMPHFFSWMIFGGMVIMWLSDSGMINQILMQLKLIKQPILFMTNLNTYRWVAILSDVWKEVGWNTILYLAAITAIDPGLYEAARIDGAGKIKQVLHVTLPGIRGIVTLMLILSLGSLIGSNLDQALVLQNNVNLPVSEVLDSYVILVGLKNGNYSMATAIGLFTSVISVSLVLTSRFISNKVNGKDESLNVF